MEGAPLVRPPSNLDYVTVAALAAAVAVSVTLIPEAVAWVRRRRQERRQEST